MTLREHVQNHAARNHLPPAIYLSNMLNRSSPTELAELWACHPDAVRALCEELGIGWRTIAVPPDAVIWVQPLLFEGYRTDGRLLPEFQPSGCLEKDDYYCVPCMVYHPTTWHGPHLPDTPNAPYPPPKERYDIPPDTE